MSLRSLALRWVAGWLGLLSYAGAFTPIGLGMATLAGSLDRNHQIQLCAGEHGTQLVLHHGRSCGSHHHGTLARALITFAQPSNTANPDHVIQFGTTDGLSRKADVTPPQPPGSEQPVLALNSTPICRPSAAPPILIPGHRSGDLQEQLLGLRTTILQI